MKWILHSPQNNRIVSEQIIKFVIKLYSLKWVELETAATSFVNSTLPYIKICGAHNVDNANDSGFNLEIHSNRTFTYKGREAIRKCCAILLIYNLGIRLTLI